MPLNLQIAEAPKDGVCTLEEAIQFFRIPDLVTPDERNLIDLCVQAATGAAERYTRRALRPQTWRLYLPCFPRCRSFELPFPPLKSVEKIQYVKEDGTTTADIDESVYDVNAFREPGQVALRSFQSWPVDLNPNFSVSNIFVEFVCGYDATNKIPAELKLATMQLAKHFYDSRDPVVVGPGGIQAVIVPINFQWMFDFWRVLDFHEYVV